MNGGINQGSRTLYKLRPSNGINFKLARPTFSKQRTFTAAVAFPDES